MDFKIETDLDLEEELLLLEKAAREQFRDATVVVANEERNLSWGGAVTQGLPKEAYRLLVRPAQAETFSLLLPSGDRADVDCEEPGNLFLSGSARFCNLLRELVVAYVPERGEKRFPLAHHVQNARDAEEICRILFSYAGRLGAQVFLSSEENGGRLIRISGTWILDTVDEPLDMLIRKGRSWAIYHFPEDRALESSSWFFEKDGILKHIVKTEGGMTNG